jgi:hypothetical protein
VAVCLLRSSALTQNSLESFPWYITLSFETDGIALFNSTSFGLKGTAISISWSSPHTKHAIPHNQQSCMYDWDFNCFIAAKIVFKQTSCVPWGSAKSPAAKTWCGFIFAIIAVTMAISSSLIGFFLYMPCFKKACLRNEYFYLAIQCISLLERFTTPNSLKLSNLNGINLIFCFII